MQQAPNQTDKATDIGQMTQIDRATNVTHFASIQRTQTEGNRYVTHSLQRRGPIPDGQSDRYGTDRASNRCSRHSNTGSLRFDDDYPGRIVADIATRPFGLMIWSTQGQTDRQTLSVQHEIFRAKDAKVCVKSCLHENKRPKTARQEYTTQTSTAPQLAVLRMSGSTTDRCCWRLGPRQTGIVDVWVNDKKDAADVWFIDRKVPVMSGSVTEEVLLMSGSMTEKVLLMSGSTT